MKKQQSKIDLLENAVSSIQMGIQDYQSPEDHRLVSAVRNFYAGVLLLGKQCLLNNAPEADPMDVLGAKYEPELDTAGKLVFQPIGHRTIDLSELRGRFKKFKLEWPKGEIDNLQKLRNDFEHFHSKETKEQIQQIIAKCFPMVEKFCEILDVNPATELGDAWKVMLEEKNFYQTKKDECDLSFKAISWPQLNYLSDIQCPNCSSSLLYQKDAKNKYPENMKVFCKACPEEIEASDLVELIINEEFGADDYRSVKDGDYPAINDCPECNHETYVHTSGVNMCYYCMYAIDEDCALCTEPLTVHNMSVNNSSYCCSCDERMSRDD